MTPQIITKINDALTGKIVTIQKHYPHVGERCRIVGFSTIDGCTEPGLLVKNFRIGKERLSYRVFNLNNIIIH